MKISIITLFPEVFEPVLNSSILKRAQAKDKISFELINLRNFGEGVHQVVDGRPYGGGPGMLLRADILAKAINSVKKKKSHVILTSASGKPYLQKDAQRLSKLSHITIICGHYEGIDERFIGQYVDEEFSIGDFVLTGGEVPAMAIADSIVRLIPGVLKKSEAIVEESFTNPDLLEYPQYTRPDTFEGKGVPEILLSGNHQAVDKWRAEQAKEKTKKMRPDLFKKLN
ncbi:MAG: tRNA (guanosine(37)-N1)-methyltransferase TrmD [Candidatus Daviesbacteria bacterium]|nr:tRNA (guanosine(37)-N1)-methyltransferase TrmD [Candidatus Daviesbacteria bacterium]